MSVDGPQRSRQTACIASRRQRRHAGSGQWPCGSDGPRRTRDAPVRQSLPCALCYVRSVYCTVGDLHAPLQIGCLLLSVLWHCGAGACWCMLMWLNLGLRHCITFRYSTAEL